MPPHMPKTMLHFAALALTLIACRTVHRRATISRALVDAGARSEQARLGNTAASGEAWRGDSFQAQ